MSNKFPSPTIAEIMPTGIIAAICGIGAISVLFQNLILACLSSVVGILAGITTLRAQVEKLDKIFAVIGITLSIVPLIYTIAIFI